VTEQQQRRTRMTAEERREVFAEVGYLRGRTSVVARRIGVSEPVVFQNFGTKATLFAAVVDRAADHVCRMVERVTTADVPVSDLLKVMLDPEHLRHVHSAGSVGAIFADAATISDEPEIEAATRRAVQQFAAAITGLLDRGRAGGELRADLDTEAAAWWLLSMVASQKFRQTTAADPHGIEARLAEGMLAFLVER
jgi:AcrR family transcriptional regulator